MKKNFTLFILAFMAFVSNSQVVLNEVYTDPGSGNSEFFEFYNSGTTQLPENLDNYTVVSYYDDGIKSGFYVLDMPAASLSAKSYFTGASSLLFNVQGKTNLTAGFSWNSLSGTSYLKKFEKNGTGYTEVAVSANLNDLFVKRTGTGAAHHIFIYKNGLLVNGLLGGCSAPVLPAYIKSMPPLLIDMSGTSPDFTISFSAIADNRFEYVNAMTGSDNGFLRLRDGKCGDWDKSSNSAQHTPGTSNGSAVGVSGELNISSYISFSTAQGSSSVLNYTVSGSSADVFPVVIEAYRDLGFSGQLDAADILFHTNTVYSTSSLVYQATLISAADKVILVAKSPAGCYDQVLTLNNNRSSLPVQLNNFQGSKNKNNVMLQWNVGINEIANSFEVERSTDGRTFETVSVVFGTEKTGNEMYSYTESNDDAKVFYRLKMTDKSNVVLFSRILVFNNAVNNVSSGLNITGNIVNDKLTLNFSSEEKGYGKMSMLDMSGRVVFNQSTVNISKGINVISISLPAALNAGMYIISLHTDNLNGRAKFIKQ